MQTELLVYALRDSAVRRMDPRWKLAAALFCGAAVLSLRTVPAAAAAIAATLLLLAISRLPWSWFLTRLGGVAVFLALFFIFLPFTMNGELTFIGPVQLSLDGVALASLIALKALSCVALVLLVLGTSPFESTLQAAHALHVPGLFVQLLMLTHRYLHLLADELGKLRVALRVRAYRNRARAHCFRTVGNVTGTLLVRSYERAERVSHAMRCRGFDGRFRSLCEFDTRATDVVLFAFTLLLVAALPLLLEWGPVLLQG
jgi:cobalt/nickel transport system permease protein